ncbi:Uncharacterised protein [uncultured archaeon]|nr:Uncharacterised protein [uncultured archaeon]
MKELTEGDEKIIESNETNFDSVADEFKKFSEEVKNPIIVGALLSKLQEERARSNLLFKELNVKLDRIMSLEDRINDLEDVIRELLGAKVKTVEEKQVNAPTKILLTQTQEKIINIIKTQEKADAEVIRKKLNYKGKNAASQQLTELVDKGLLQRKQVGRRVFFMLN